MAQDVFAVYTLPLLPAVGGRSCDIGRLHRVLEVRISRGQPHGSQHGSVDFFLPRNLGLEKPGGWSYHHVEGVTIAWGVQISRNHLQMTHDGSGLHTAAPRFVITQKLTKVYKKRF